MLDSEMKDLIILQLNKFLKGLQGSRASSIGLAATQGGLCGVAALHQALGDTFLTPSQLSQHSYRDMRIFITNHLGLDMDSTEDTSDTDLLQQFYSSKQLQLIGL